MTEDDAWLVLGAAADVGPVTVHQLLQFYEQDPVRALQSPEDELVQAVGPRRARAVVKARKEVDPARIRDEMARVKARFVNREQPDYPRRLLQMPGAPIGLFCRGAWNPENVCVAVVGTRRASIYGRNIARMLGRELAAAGVCVVSGLAAGIDGETHRGALESGGPTIAVMGTGPDIIFPPDHRGLADEIAGHGAIMTEFPPGRRGDRQSFPQRNRVIAGMSEAVVIVESAQHGGSMITAQFAAEQGCLVYAVPGRIDQENSRGCHALIREGATLLDDVGLLLEDLQVTHRGQGMRPADRVERGPSPRPKLDPRFLPIARAVAELQPVHPDRIAEKTGYAIELLTVLLLEMELSNVVQKTGDGCYELVAGDVPEC